ncbi:MAG: hypothetical protein ACR2QG_02240 [Gammaproteobacteria bacterium]
MSYETIVVAICAGLKSQHGVTGADEQAIAADIVGQHGRMPDYLRLPLLIATYVFDFAGLFSGGKRFRHKDSESRQMQLETWKRSRVGSCRNFVRFYESLFLLVALQEPPA